MQRRIWNLIIAMALMVVGHGAVEAATQAGPEAQEFTLTDSTGAKRSLSEFRGRFVVLEWVNPECPFVRKHYDSNNMQHLQRRYAERGVVWLSIDSSAPSKQGHLTQDQAAAWLKERDASPTALLLDPAGEVGKLYNARTTPHMFIVNREGQLIYQGAIDDKPSTNPQDVKGAKNYVQQALDEAMSGAPVSEASSQPYGCSVKY